MQQCCETAAAAEYPSAAVLPLGQRASPAFVLPEQSGWLSSMCCALDLEGRLLPVLPAALHCQLAEHGPAIPAARVVCLSDKLAGETCRGMQSTSLAWYHAWQGSGCTVTAGVQTGRQASCCMQMRHPDAALTGQMIICDDIVTTSRLLANAACWLDAKLLVGSRS